MFATPSSSSGSAASSSQNRHGGVGATSSLEHVDNGVETPEDDKNHFKGTPPPPPTVSTPKESSSKNTSLQYHHSQLHLNGTPLQSSMSTSTTIGHPRDNNNNDAGDFHLLEGHHDNENNTNSSILSLFQMSEPLTDDLSNFEELMKERRRQRREKEDAAVSELRVQVRRLEAALAAESKRRVAAVQQWTEQTGQQIRDMESRLTTEWNEEQQLQAARMSALEKRMTALEERWEKDTQHLATEISKKSAAFQHELEELRSSVETARASRLQREGELLQQLEDVAARFTEKYKQERSERIQAMDILHSQMEQQQQHVQEQLKHFDERVKAELTALQNELRVEMTERMAQDQDIVTLLNRYAKQMQASMAIVSGV